MRMEVPIRWEELKEEDKNLVVANYSNPTLFDFVQYENKLVIPRYFVQNMADRIFNFTVREDDIWVVSYPKAGTTLTLELVWHLINNKVRESYKTYHFYWRQVDQILSNLSM